ncbi:hypothetical protein LKR43_07295 [Pusillimonas sp. MFBS29]|uniref:hypothetical protein n=1 Tax=Pusillimonas sp. MFBS29 TaxID=2886690 RepID=UPI001D0F8C29|nr:hypothetical protein [Pusillimonas sp. MFBS29]MCC2596141.1 hypothetical protein [Pusillimonas sp. MFBS29]
MAQNLSRSFALVVGLSALSFSAYTQASPEQFAQQFAQAGATIQAVAEECGDYTQSQLKEMRKQQQTSVSAMGVSVAQYDQMFEASYNNARTQIAMASPAEKAEMCEQMKVAGSGN